jgi:phosphonate transport system substrate-binding protein
MLRFITCLAENTQPLAQTLSDYLTDALNTSIIFDSKLSYETRKEGLLSGQISLGFTCGLLYSLLKNQGAPLQPLVAPVSRSVMDTTPTYYSYVIVRNDSVYPTLESLEQTAFCINEWESFSGCQIMRYHLATLAKFQGFFSKVIESGSHMQSIQKVLLKQADSAAIDHTLYEYWKKNTPESAWEFRVIERLGPFPMPPLVISKYVPETLKEKIQTALLQMPPELLSQHDVQAFQTVNDQTYDPIREAVQLGEQVQFS